MLDAYFFRFGKRVNSTIAPVTQGGEHLRIQLIEPTSVINPTVTLDSPNPTAFNYCYIPTFQRYYFINNWTWENSIWAAQLNCDVLASWADAIGASTNYVLRSASNWDGSIVDNMYPVCATATFARNLADSAPFSKNWMSTGYFSVGVVNNNYAKFGATSYFIMPQQTMQKFLNVLLGNISIYNVSADEISEDLQKMLFNPSKYISSVTYLPFEAVYSSGLVVESIPCGWWSYDLGLPAYLIQQGYDTYAKDFTITLSKHPQQSTRGVYTNAAPYTERNLVIWPFGEIPLDTSCMAEVSYLYCRVEVDQITGLGILYVYLDSAHSQLLLTRQTQVGIPCQIAQISTDLQALTSNALTTTVAAGIGAVTSFFGGSDNISGIANGIGSALQASASQVEVQGSTGSLIGYDTTPAVYSTFKAITDDNLVDFGRPLCRRVQISSLHDYILCSDAEVPGLLATAEEQNQIRNYMNTGFYYQRQEV